MTRPKVSRVRVRMVYDACGAGSNDQRACQVKVECPRTHNHLFFAPTNT